MLEMAAEEGFSVYFVGAQEEILEEAVANLKQKDVMSAAFPKQFAKLCKSASPFCAFVAGAVGLEW